MDKQRIRHGANLSAIILGLIAVVILVNVAVGILVSKFPIKLDLTQNKLFQLSEETINLLKSVDKDVKIYYLIAPGSEITIVKETLDRYSTYSSHVTVETRDPVADPFFAKEFERREVTVEQGGVIVECGDKARGISYYDMLQLEQDQMGNQSAAGLQLESKLTSAISYVTDENSGRIYFVTGHGEYDSSVYSAILDAENIAVSDTSLMTGDIPEDCDGLFIVAPSRDFSADEIDKLAGYLENGGTVNIYFEVGANPERLLSYLREEWGINAENSMVLETDASRIINRNPAWIVPDAGADELISGINDTPIVFVGSRRILLNDIEGITSSVLFQSSEKALTKPYSDQLTAERQPGDTEGAANLSVSAVKNGTLFVHGTSSIIDQAFTAETSVWNYDYLMAISKKMSNKTVSFSILPKDLRPTGMIMPESVRIMYTLIFVGIIPLFILGMGIFTWVRRKNL